MQINLNHRTLTHSVASNQPSVAPGLQVPPLSHPVIEPAAPDENVQPSVTTVAKRTPQALLAQLSPQIEYEQEAHSQRGAIAQYLQTQYAAKREAIQQMVGIDIYA
ncbi:MAG: hypothetical protein ACRCVV_09340 [Shewanella sp.]